MSVMADPESVPAQFQMANRTVVAMNRCTRATSKRA